jgi:predicted ArsR family transcriptional regulator
VKNRGSDYIVIQRTVDALAALKSKPLTRYELGDVLKVHDRTAYRLLQAMVEAKLVVVESKSVGRAATTYRATHKLTRR